MNNKSGIKVGGIFTFECFSKNGKLKWREEAHNLVTTAGLTHINNILFAGGTQVNPWYLGLTDGTPTPAAADTLASHSGWSEVTAYTGDRKAYVDVVSGGSVTNSASVAAFAINSSTTLGGGFLGSAASGTSGTLLSVVAFSGGNKSADDGDTVNVTYTWTTADDA